MTTHLIRCVGAGLVASGVLLFAGINVAAEGVFDERLHHLRNGEPREWAEFPERAEAAELVITFDAVANAAEQTLWIRQQDVKQIWVITLNGKKLGELERDEKDITRAWAVPPGSLKSGTNTLTIAARPNNPVDDIRVGMLRLDPRPVSDMLGEARVQVTISEEGNDARLPSRLTILDEHGSLTSLAATLSDRLAVRTGTIYTVDGRADFGLPAGKYIIHASRGFEYSLARHHMDLKAGETQQVSLQIRREVPMPAYISTDTHLHTFTFSRHGDATLTERMITLAGEGIEMPIATDHNVHIDYEDEARRIGARRYFTPVMGCEVTTKFGHFNIFPVAPESRPADWKLTTWPEIFDSIDAVPGIPGIPGVPGVKAVILNHGRDVHYKFRPLGPAQHNSATGENLHGWTLRANGMEVINSAATMGDPMRLVHDWMTLLNRGYRIAPVGASDSHDVSRHMAGQGRTYIRYADDGDASSIDVNAAVRSFTEGRTIASYGLAALLTVNDRYGPGDLVPADGEMKLTMQLFGPSWTTSDRLVLFANGEQVLVQNGERRPQSNGKYEDVAHRMPRPTHDVHLALVALGPGVTGPHFPLAKPYQPTSIEWRPYVMSVCGAVYVDADGDGRFSSAHQYATTLVRRHAGDDAALLAALAEYDAAVAAQAASLLLHAGRTVDDLATLSRDAAAAVQRGFDAFIAAHRENLEARTP